MKNITAPIIMLLCLMLSINTTNAQQTFTDKTLGWRLTMPDDWEQATKEIYDDNNAYKKVSYTQGTAGKIAMSTHPLPDDYIGKGKEFIQQDIDQMLNTLKTSLADSKEWSIKWKTKEVTIGNKTFQSLHIELLHKKKLNMTLDMYEWTDDECKWVITTSYNTDKQKNIIDKAVTDAANSF